MAKLDQISVGGTIYEMVPEIAPLFNESTAYAVGDCVIKDAVLYRFTTAHAAGAWVGTDAEEITVGDEITNLKADLKTNITLMNDGYATLDGEWQIGNLSGSVGSAITINTAFKNRLAGVTQYKFDYDTTFYIRDGYRAYIYMVDENNIVLAAPKSLISSGSVSIPSNTIVRIGIEKIPVEVITNINEYVLALTHTIKAFVDIANLKETVDVIPENSIFGIFKKGMRPMLFSHAGYKTDYPENTIPAFVAAGEKKYFGIEADVNVTRDGYFVMIHDTTVDSATSGTGNVADLTLAEIRALHIKNYPDLKVPTLEEYLGICKMYGCVPMIEIKGTLQKEHIGNMIDVIKKYALQHDVLLIGSKWSIGNVREFTDFIPYLCVYQRGFSVTFETELSYCENYKNAGMLFEYTYALTNEQIQSAHAANIAIGTFVIDDKTDILDAFMSGYDSVTTNTVVL